MKYKVGESVRIRKDISRDYITNMCIPYEIYLKFTKETNLVISRVDEESHYNIKQVGLLERSWWFDEYCILPCRKHKLERILEK